MKKTDEKRAMLSLCSSMLIFGSIGLFVKYVDLPSAWIAAVRGGVGTLFLLLLVLITGKKISGKAIRANFLWLVLSGAAIGFNWILLFEAYRYTTVAVATVCYYMEPVFVMLLSPILLKEKLTARKSLCCLVALCGMVLVSGLLTGGLGNTAVKGPLFGLGAAALYTTAIFLNKRLKNITAYDRTIVQLGIAAIVVLPYALISQKVSFTSLSPMQYVWLAVIAIVHTGIAYALYFGSMDALESQTIAVFSYIDPAFAVLLSVLVLREDTGILEILGAALILGSTFFCEFRPKKKPLNKESA